LKSIQMKQGWERLLQRFS